MIYCYLSDSALTPLVSNTIFTGNDLFGSYTNRSGDTVRSGVCQINERVLSIFSNDNTTSAGGMPDSNHNIIKDPRAADERIRGLFTGDSAYVLGAANERAYGNMHLHFDKYWAALENLPENNIWTLNASSYIPQFKKLFNVIECAVLSHVYDHLSNLWIYKNSNEIDISLRANTSLFGAGGISEDDPNPGYVAGSMSVHVVDVDGDKQATVKNINANGNVDIEIGTNSISKNSSIIFPNIIQFQFRFSNLPKPTWFKIYLNPDTLIKEYAKSLITNVVMPTDPVEIVDLGYSNSINILSTSSEYVANTLTGEVTRTTTDPLLTTNHTGAVDFPLKYAGDKILHFTCIYKGRVPTDSEMRETIRKILETARGGSVEDILPELYIKTNFIIVPLYHTRITADTNLNIKYCRNIVPGLDVFKNYGGKNTAASINDVPSDVINTSSVLNVAGYYMYVLVYSLAYTEEHYTLTEDTVFLSNKTYYTRTGSSFNYVYTVARVIPGDDVPANTYYEYVNSPEIIPVRISEIDEFESYQPIGTTDSYWYTLSDAAIKLNATLSKIIASEINGTVIPADVECHMESKEVFEALGYKNYITFTAGDYSFSVMTKESYYATA